MKLHGIIEHTLKEKLLVTSEKVIPKRTLSIVFAGYAIHGLMRVFS